MPNYPNMPHADAESDALREEARRLALSVGESYPRGQVLADTLIHLDASSPTANFSPLSPNTIPQLNPEIEFPERRAIRSAEISVGKAASERVAQVGEWIQYARDSHQHPGV